MGILLVVQTFGHNDGHNIKCLGIKVITIYEEVMNACQACLLKTINLTKALTEEKGFTEVNWIYPPRTS